MENNKMHSLLIRKLQAELEANHQGFPVGLEVLELCASMDTFEIDYERLLHLESWEFFYAMYICMLKRFPDKENRIHWKKRMEELNREEFHKEVLLAVATAPESRFKGTYMINCPLLNTVEVTPRIEKRPRGLMLYQKYHWLYMKLPVLLRKIAKKVLKQRMIGNV